VVKFEGKYRANSRLGGEIKKARKGHKKRQATYIAPLQPPTLATFRSWGSSAGAGRARPAGAKIGVSC